MAKIPQEPRADPVSTIQDLLGTIWHCLDLAEEGLALFEESAPPKTPHERAMVRDYLAMAERAAAAAAAAEPHRRARLRRLIGAKAYVDQLVIVQNCLRRLVKVAPVGSAGRAKAEGVSALLDDIIDRGVRDSGQHVDDRVAHKPVGAPNTLVIDSFLEEDCLSSTLADGTIGKVRISRSVLDQVRAALLSIVLPDGRPLSSPPA